jgi:hypothetical protein
MRKIVSTSFLMAVSLSVYSQSNEPSITGNIESTFQYLNADSLIGADQPESIGLMNSYINTFYTQGNFKAGLRLESYLPRIQGYPDQFDGTGVGMRYVGYANDMVDVTLGSFYEQFGSGMAFRAYEDRALGYDNVMDGMRLIVRPTAGVVLKGVYGSQRLSFQEGRVIKADGIVRGIDGEVNLNTAIPRFAESKLNVSLGGSFVSKYQKDDDERWILPENVATYGARTKLRYEKFTFSAEYVQKENDPSVDNLFLYNKGHAALFNFGYSQKGLGIMLSGKSVDNMSFRSDRNQVLQDVLINYLPSMNKTHTYNLVASLYPYATQPLGEIAYQAEVLYTLKKGSKWGGKYGTSINGNYSVAYQPIHHTSGINLLDSSRILYKGLPFDKSDNLLWQDINVNISRKFSKNFNVIVSYFDIMLNNDVAKVSNDAAGIIHSHIGVLEMGYKFNTNHSIRTELQGLFTKRDKGNWSTVLVEYSLYHNWFVSVMDQYNYGNPNEDLQLHYFISSMGYVKESTRFMLSYGRQRAGIFCVGGVCRSVPASNGLTFTFTQSF